jgi:hypothetical protein
MKYIVLFFLISSQNIIDINDLYLKIKEYENSYNRNNNNNPSVIADYLFSDSFLFPKIPTPQLRISALLSPDIQPLVSSRYLSLLLHAHSIFYIHLYLLPVCFRLLFNNILSSESVRNTTSGTSALSSLYISAVLSMAGFVNGSNRDPGSSSGVTVLIGKVFFFF